MFILLLFNASCNISLCKNCIRRFSDWVPEVVMDCLRRTGHSISGISPNWFFNIFLEHHFVFFSFFLIRQSFCNQLIVTCMQWITYFEWTIWRRSLVIFLLVREFSISSERCFSLIESTSLPYCWCVWSLRLQDHWSSIHIILSNHVFLPFI